MEINETYFSQKVSQFYSDVERDFLSIGCENLGMQDRYFRLSRVAIPFVDYITIKRILLDIDGATGSDEEIQGHRRWPLAWGKAANHFAGIAEQAEQAGYHTTAKINFLRASLLAHSGQLFSRPIWDEKRTLQQLRTKCYQKAADYFGMKRMIIPMDEGFIPGYLWCPQGVKNAPLVIMIPGANSVKEELHRWAQAFHARGLATLTIDGPGQGELSLLQGGNQPLRMEQYHKVISTVITYCYQNLKSDINPEQIGLWGQATGGNLISRAYATETRIKLMVNLDGPPTMDAYPYLPGDILEEQRDVLGFSTFEETWQYLQKHGSALEQAKFINIPYLLIHGSKNPIFNQQAVDAWVQAIGDNLELWIYDDGNLGVFNYDLEMTDRMADWVLTQLSQ